MLGCVLPRGSEDFYLVLINSSLASYKLDLSEYGAYFSFIAFETCRYSFELTYRNKAF